MLRPPPRPDRDRARLSCRFPPAKLVVAGLDARRDHEPVPGVDRGDREEEGGELAIVELGALGLPPIVGHVLLADERHRLARRERGALAVAVERALAPRVEHVEPVLALAG